MNQESLNIDAQARIHHAFLLGLQLMVSSNKHADIVGDWMFRLFRRQHLDKFLPGFAKLGLTDLPDAVACAQYHVMSNSVGGVPVEYMYESDRKAWVRFRYPRWMYDGPTICGIPVSVSRGFLEGWYAHNGVSLKNPRLGFVCVSEDMTGEFGFCGYFKEYDHELLEEERLQFAWGELPPVFNPENQPGLPNDQWNDERLQKANRNYAIDYIRNGLIELSATVGSQECKSLAGRAARLIGLQYMNETRLIIGTDDGGLSSGADYLSKMFTGMGDEVTVEQVEGVDDRAAVKVTQRGLRIVHGLDGEQRDLVLDCWIELWIGALSAYREMKVATVQREECELVWIIQTRVR